MRQSPCAVCARNNEALENEERFGDKHTHTILMPDAYFVFSFSRYKTETAAHICFDVMGYLGLPSIYSTAKVSMQIRAEPQVRVVMPSPVT